MGVQLNQLRKSLMYGVNVGCTGGCLGERLNGIQEVSGSIPLISTTGYTREKACFKRNEPFLVCVFRRLAYPGHASTLPHGAFRFFERPFFHAHF